MLRTQACVTGDAFLDVTPELSAGVHTVVFDPMADRTGSAVLTLYDVPADITGSITPGGAAVPVTIASSALRERVAHVRGDRSAARQPQCGELDRGPGRKLHGGDDQASRWLYGCVEQLRDDERRISTSRR